MINNEKSADALFKENPNAFKDKLLKSHLNLKNDSKIASNKIKIFFTLFLILNFTIYINLFRPIMLIMNLIFSATLTLDQINTKNKNNTNSYLMLIGILLIIILPLLPLFRYSSKVLKLENKLGNKIFYFIILLIECMFDLPLTFLYSSNRHSLFLLEQEGFEQIINPWLIFFPTDYITSFICIFKNALISGYFIFISVFVKVLNINANVVEFSNIFKACVIAFNIVNVLGIIFIFIFMCVYKKKKKHNK